MSIYSGFPIPLVNVPVIPGNVYNINPGINEQGILLVNGSQTQTLYNGVGVQVIAQLSILVFQYPQLVPNGSVYTAHNFGLSFLLGLTNYVLVWGANELDIINTQSGTINNPGAGQYSQFGSPFHTSSLFLQSNLATGSVTSSIYLAPGSVQFTASVTQPGVQETFQQTAPITIYTGKLGGVDYRYGSDFTLVNADPIVTQFQASNPGGTLSIPLPFTFPTNSSPQPNQ